MNVPVYGQSGIQDYWILDGQERCLYVFRQPNDTGYAVEQPWSDQDAIAPLVFPACALQVQDFLRSPH